MTVTSGTTIRPIEAIPGPPFLQVIKQAWKDPLAFLLNAALTYGDPVRLRIRDENILVISHPDHLKHVLQDNYKNYVKGYEVTKPLLGEGLLTIEGHAWRKRRRLMQPMFHRRRIAAMADTMVAEIQKMLARWEPYAASGQPLDVAAEMMHMTRDVILATMFSSSISPEEAEAAGKAFQAALAHFDRYMFMPVQLPDFVPLPGSRRFRRAIETLDRIVYGLIRRRRAMANPPDDLLTMLIQAQDEESGEGLSDAQIRDEVMTIFLAGHETTANALAWTWYLLSLHPDVTRRMWAELDHVLAGRAPTFQDVAELRYTTWIFQEAMRLYPPAWIFARTAVAQDEIGGYTVPAGTPILISPYVTHRRPDLWPNPLGFDPERFTPEEVKKRHRFAYLPFSRGPRVCIGEGFAMAEGVLTLAAVGQRYRLDLLPGFPVKPRSAGTLGAKHGIQMTLHPRKERG